MPFYTFVPWSIVLASLGTVTIVHVGPVNIRPYQLPGIIGFFLLCIAALRRKRFVLPLFPAIFAGGFVAICFFSTAVATFPALSIKQSSFIMFFVILFLLISASYMRYKTAIQILVWLHISSCAICIRELLVIAGFLPGNDGTEWSFFYRPRSLFVEGNEFGVYLVFVFGFVVASLITGKRIVPRWLVLLTLGLIIAVLIPNMSRGSWLGCFVALVVVYLLTRKSRNSKKATMSFVFTLGFISALCVGAAFAIQAIVPVKVVDNALVIIGGRIDSLLKGKDQTSLIRLNTNIKALKALMDSPVLGIGMGNVLTILNDDEDGVNAAGGLARIRLVRTSSNLFTDIAAETGLSGLLIFVLFIISIFATGMRNLRRCNSDISFLAHIGAFGSFCGICLNGMTYATHMLPFLWISAAMVATPRGKTTLDEKTLPYLGVS